MKNQNPISILFTLVVLSALAFTTTRSWEISQGYYIRFHGKYADGTFEKLSGRILFDPLHPSDAKFDVTVDVNSIETGKNLKNKHALSENWFDAEKFPVIHFVSDQISLSDTAFLVSGELDLHGVKKQITIPFKFYQEEGRARFTGTLSLNRGEFGVGKSNGKSNDYTVVDIDVPVHGN